MQSGAIWVALHRGSITIDLNLARRSLTHGCLMTLHPDTLAYPPRGMSRDEAARYVGVTLALA
jgi:hypothetical protein